MLWTLDVKQGEGFEESQIVYPIELCKADEELSDYLHVGGLNPDPGFQTKQPAGWKSGSILMLMQFQRLRKYFPLQQCMY